MTTVTQLIYPQCVACRKGLLPGAPSAVGAITINAGRGWHLCAACKGRGRAVLGGVVAVAGRVLEQNSPEAFKLARDFYIGMRGAQQVNRGA